MEDGAFRKFLEITLKIHQIFALVDVSYTSVFSSGRGQNLQAHFNEITAQLNEHNGLNYVPREKSINGRIFEHAADSRVLIDQLRQIEDGAPVKDTGNYFVRIIDEPQVSTSKDGKSLEDEKNAAEIKLAEKYQARIFDDLKIKHENIILNLNKPFIQLTMKANGKADLYFHAYFWEKYLKQISEGSSSPSGAKSARKKKQIIKKPDEEEQDPGSGPAEEETSETPITSGGNIDLFSGKYPFMKRLIGLSATLSKVIVNIKKFPFHEKMYHKYAKEFGQR